jgi:hypothetical protein
MAKRIYNTRRVGTEIYSTELISSHQAREVYGLTNESYYFNYVDTSVAQSARQFEMCNMSTASDENGRLPRFVMSGVVQVLPNGYVMNSRGVAKDCKNVYVVVFCRMGGLNHPKVSTFANTLAIPYSGGYGYKTMREAIDHARRHMINHYYAIRGVHGEGMANDMSLAHFMMKPYVRKELEAAVAQVDAALATTPIDLDKYKAAAQRLQMDCDALTAIHNASKPCGTSVAILSKESMSNDANAVLPNATWEDLKKLAFDIYTSECQCIIDEADSQIDAIKHRRDSKLHQESVKKDEVVNLVCDRSRTVAARLRSLNDAYWGYVIEIHGKKLDVYA